MAGSRSSKVHPLRCPCLSSRKASCHDVNVRDREVGVIRDRGSVDVIQIIVIKELFNRRVP